MIAKEANHISFSSRVAGIDLALQMARLWCLYEIGSSPPEEAWSISLMALVNHYLGFAILPFIICEIAKAQDGLIRAMELEGLIFYTGNYPI